MFKMLWDTNFTYDSSMPIYENRPPSWPYTLDYKLFHDCMIPPCPTRSYPGLWEVPMVMWQDLNGGRCSMGDACSNPPTADGVYKMLIKNFERHYTTNRWVVRSLLLFRWRRRWSTIRRDDKFFRAPFGLFYHAAWFTQPHHKEGFISFLDTIVAMDDVWIVTNWQAIQWVRNPTPLPLLHTFEPFGCNYPVRRYTCIFLFRYSMRNREDSFDLSWNFRSIGSAEEVQQPEGVQSMAQERGEVHEDLSNVSGHLSVDGQDRDTKQSHRQRCGCARMRREGGGERGIGVPCDRGPPSRSEA